MADQTTDQIRRLTSEETEKLQYGDWTAVDHLAAFKHASTNGRTVIADDRLALYGTLHDELDGDTFDVVVFSDGTAVATRTDLHHYSEDTGDVVWTSWLLYKGDCR